MRREIERLQDIGEAISAIECYANQGWQAFDVIGLGARVRR